MKHHEAMYTHYCPVRQTKMPANVHNVPIRQTYCLANIPHVCYYDMIG